MPELPEVETIMREVRPMVLHRSVVAAGSHPSERFRSAELAVGSSFVEVGRRGKYLIFELSDGCDLVVHLGMTGRLRLTQEAAAGGGSASASGAAAGATVRGAAAAGGEEAAGAAAGGEGAGGAGYVRAWWGFEDGCVLELHDVRRFGRVRVTPRGCHEAIPNLASLGPEPLGGDFTPSDFWRALRRSRSPVKTQLLSGRPVAGLGNIYADEALWSAGVHPGRRRITKAEAERLHTAIREVLEQAIENRGTTFRDYRTLSGSGGDNAAHLNCYGLAGTPCRRCGEELRSYTLSARTTTFCRRCQR